MNIMQIYLNGLFLLQLFLMQLLVGLIQQVNISSDFTHSVWIYASLYFFKVFYLFKYTPKIVYFLLHSVDGSHCAELNEAIQGVYKNTYIDILIWNDFLQIKKKNSSSLSGLAQSQKI